DGIRDFHVTGVQTCALPIFPNLDYDEVDAAEGFPGLKNLAQNYALKFSGSINIVEEAEYELCLHSDDGSQLLLEDTVVVDNDGRSEERRVGRECRSRRQREA